MPNEAPAGGRRLESPDRGAADQQRQHRHQHDHQHHAGEAGPASDPPADALLSARALTLSRAGRTILDAISIHIASGEIVTLIGPNGAGKTTLVRVLIGLEPPDSGTIARRPGLRLGYAPQRFDRDPAVPMTVDRFLSLGTPGRRGTRDVLAEVGAKHVAGQQLSALSGGELQRVVLARALLRHPDLLVLDEPVRGVDYAGEAELYDLIGRLRDERGLGVLLVSHDLHVVMAQSDRVVCLNRHVCCEGIPESVAQHPEYVRLFGASAAPAFALYQHHHDHAHDLSGAPHPEPAPAAVSPKGSSDHA